MNKRDIPWLDAITKVLEDNGRAMHYTDIAQAVVDSQYRGSVGATPAATVGAYISTDVKDNGESSRFIRSAPGQYMLRSANTETAHVVQLQSLPATPSTAQIAAATTPDAEATGSVKALGMYWRRELVYWSSSAPKLLGQQQRGATEVDFAKQRGVYLLHDGRATVYVGRVTDQPLSRRLLQHTQDRLNGRWDRFSWFGLLSVSDKGELRDEPIQNRTAEGVIYDLEAVLIEALEPPLNRRRGDGLTASEYIQVEDEAIRAQKDTQAVQTLLANQLTRRGN